jgi:hypothetical protein
MLMRLPMRGYEPLQQGAARPKKRIAGRETQSGDHFDVTDRYSNCRETFKSQFHLNRQHV